ncbi:unnamed protein product, partial [Prorocentrum cordatum]
GVRTKRRRRRRRWRRRRRRMRRRIGGEGGRGGAVLLGDERQNRAAPADAEHYKSTSTGGGGCDPPSVAALGKKPRLQGTKDGEEEGGTETEEEEEEEPEGRGGGGAKVGRLGQGREEGEQRRKELNRQMWAARVTSCWLPRDCGNGGRSAAATAPPRDSQQARRPDHVGLPRSQRRHHDRR